MARGLTRQIYDQLVQQLADHHDGMTTCEICGWSAEEVAPPDEQA